MNFSITFAGLCLAVYALTSCTEVSSQTASDQTDKDITVTDDRNLTDTSGAVSWLARPDNIYFLKGSGPDEFFIYYTVSGNESSEKLKRAPLNISLVLDRSGSMQGDKLEYAKNAATFVVSQLGSEDYISVVDYDHNVEIVSASGSVTNKEVLINKIAAISPRGSTNLSGGMLEGFWQAGSTKKTGFVNRVLLLTDGLANAGITDPAELKKLVEKKYKAEGIALSTFGIGADYNEDLLTMMAETGRANYYFIESPDKIPGIFASELKGLLSVVAQNTWVQVKLPDGVELVQCYGYPSQLSGRTLKVELNDLFAGDKRGFLLKFRKTSPVHSRYEFRSVIYYTDAKSFESISDETKLVINETDNKKRISDSNDTLVQEMIALYESTKLYDEILSAVDDGQYEEAKNKTRSVVNYLREKQKLYPSDKLKKQEELLIKYNEDLMNIQQMKEEEVKLFQKSGKSENYRVKKGKL